MGPIIAQVVRVVATQVIKYVGKQATKEAGKQAGKQLAKQVKKETTKTIKNNNIVGGNAVKRQSIGEKFEIGNNKHFDSLDKIIESNLKKDHSAKQQVSNYLKFGLPGNMPKTNIFKMPRL